MARIELRNQNLQRL